MKINVVACTVDAADGDNGERHVGRIERVTQDNGSSGVAIGNIDLKVPCTCSIERAVVSRRNGTRGDGMEIAETMAEGRHMARCSRVV